MLVAGIGFRVVANQRCAVPEQELQPALLAAADERGHVADIGWLPVAAIAVPHRLADRLPAIIDDDRFAADLLRQFALAKDGIAVELLQERVPCGVHGQAGVIGHGAGV